jgi:hypothetical protein
MGTCRRGRAVKTRGSGRRRRAERASQQGLWSPGSSAVCETQSNAGKIIQSAALVCLMPRTHLASCGVPGLQNAHTEQQSRHSLSVQVKKEGLFNSSMAYF